MLCVAQMIGEANMTMSLVLTSPKLSKQEIYELHLHVKKAEVYDLSDNDNCEAIIAFFRTELDLEDSLEVGLYQVLNFDEPWRIFWGSWQTLFVVACERTKMFDLLGLAWTWFRLSFLRTAFQNIEDDLESLEDAYALSYGSKVGLAGDFKTINLHQKVSDLMLAVSRDLKQRLDDNRVKPIAGD